MPDIHAIIKQMTLEEKAALCTGANFWATVAMKKLQVPELTVSDGPHGLRHETDVNSLARRTLPATCFPTASAMASTWNPALVHEVGQAIAEECIAQQIDVILGPGVNMKRTPLCGRNFEYYSEDPYLAGEMAASFIDGVQSKGVGTSLKHFATNNQEDHRSSISSVMDDRTLREIYLPAFETAVKKAQPWTVMCAYNRLNGTFCSENHKLLVDILKNEWGFEGLVVSDWGAVHDRVASLMGGLDLEMPGPKENRVKAVVEAIRTGKLDEKVLDNSVFRILRIVFKAAEKAKGGDFDVQAHHALARRVAGEGIVLLKNDGTLPLTDPRRIAVIGRAAKLPHFQGRGSSRVNPTMVEIPFDELQKQAGNCEISYCEGYLKDDGIQQELIDEAVHSAKTADVALVFVGMPADTDNEGNDRTGIDLTLQQIALIKAVTRVQPKTVVILYNGSAVAMSEWINEASAVISAGTCGQGSGGAIADVIFGKVNPSGKLAETYPYRLQDTPAYINYPGGNGEVRYGEGIFIGYRYYDAKQQPVLFPFGYGGSYTTFEYSSAKVSSSTFNDVDGVTVSVDMTNTGKVAGKEVVQFYVHDRQSGLRRPFKELKEFTKVELQPGETRTVSVHLDFRAFAFYHPGYKRWIAEDGEFDLLIGASAADIRCNEVVTLRSTQQLPCILDRDSTIQEWLNDPVGKTVITPLYEKMTANVEKTHGADEFGKEEANLIIMEMLGRSLSMELGFQETSLPVQADDLVNSLLDQVYAAKDKLIER